MRTRSRKQRRTTEWMIWTDKSELKSKKRIVANYFYF